jgi:hypothetical protein
MIYLYIKTHRVTGLKYFGKTVRDPLTYRGSGLLWRRHIAKHGNDVDTEIIGQFESQEECTEVALKFSLDNNIVESDQWANLRMENGSDGAPVGHDGHNFTETDRAKMSAASLKSWAREGRKESQALSTAAAWTEDRRAEHSAFITEKWDEAARKSHSERLKHLHATEPERFEAFAECAKLPKTDDHKAKISKALKGLPKSAAHREALRQAALKRHRKPLELEESI